MALLQNTQPEDELVVFYTLKSPHMDYESLRQLKESSREIKFVKCFEGMNALDFQLVSDLGYRLKENADCEYVIVSNDNGYLAVVKYWSLHNMPVRRISGKDCYKNPPLSSFNQTVQRRRDRVDFIVEMPSESENSFPGMPVPMQETEKSVKPAEEAEVSEAAKMTEQSNAENPVKAAASGKPAEAVKQEETVKAAEPVKSAEPAKTPKIVRQAEPEKKPEPVKTAEPAKKPESAKPVESPKPEKKPEEVKTQEQPKKEQPTVMEDTPLVTYISTLNEDVAKKADRLLPLLFGCMSKDDNLADFHNSLVLFLGENEAKSIYNDIKRNKECMDYWKKQPKLSQKEKFSAYADFVFSASEFADKKPEDFSAFLYEVKDKRDNLNSLRAALQKQYGKDRGMKYYSLFKAHIKIMNHI